MLEVFDTWYTALYEAWYAFADRLIGVAPHLIGASLILIFGSLIAMGVGEAVGSLIDRLKLDDLLGKSILQPIQKGLGVKVKIAGLVEELVKWIILIVIFIAAADVAHLSQVNEFFSEVLHYLPNVFVSVIILVVASLVATFVGNVLSNTVKDEMGYYSGLSKGAIYTFAILAALHQLQISRPLIEILFTGIVATCVIAFGLGGKEVAGEIIRKIYDDFQKSGSKKK